MSNITPFKLALTLGLTLALQYNAAAQTEEKAQKADKKAKKEEALVRPEVVGAPAVDLFTGKAFDLYDESVKITQALEFVKVETVVVPDKGDGVTSEMKISDGKGGALTKMGALKQLAELALRLNKQTEDMAAVQTLLSAATQELSTVPMTAKMKTAKSMTKSKDAFAFAAGETKKQALLIPQQISTIKALKNN